jgi:DNA-binding transcriptional MerR regulator
VTGGLRTIKAAQRLGFTLAETEELIALSEHRRGTGELQLRAQLKIAEVDARIGQLQQVREALLTVVAAECDSLSDCSCGLGCPLPVLEPTGPDGDDLSGRPA